jgi:hypothetical protein
MFSIDSTAATRAAARREMLKGTLWLVGAGLVAGATYLAADPVGTYAIFWGAAGSWRSNAPGTTLGQET